MNEAKPEVSIKANIQVFDMEGKIVGIIDDQEDVSHYEAGLKDGTLSITFDNETPEPGFIPLNLPGVFVDLAKPVTPKRRIRRNDPCFCKSGKKYKKCCLRKSE